MALALLPFLIAVGLNPFLMRKRVDKLGSKAREASGELSAHAIDSIQGLSEIVSYQQEEIRGKEFEVLTNKHISLRLVTQNSYILVKVITALQENACLENLTKGKDPLPIL